MIGRVLREAEKELDDAIAHYERIDAALSLRLRVEVRRALIWIRDNSEIPRLRPNGYRRVNLRVFPYYLPYFIWADAIWILAFAHGHRKPEYWIERVDKLA